ncbi:MAG: hypothetical protein H0U49_10480, partial [Parachlamydiaceae bacterium]|nr:hypothetical protein [Parachlamydiaceae bacterium]
MINLASISNNSSAPYNTQRVNAIKWQASNFEETQKECQIPFTGNFTAFDQYWQDLKNVDFIDSKGIPTEEISKLYPLGSFDNDEFKTWFNFVTRPIQARLGIQFSLVEFYAFLFTIAPAAGIKILSTNICGGAIPEMFSSYYIRTLNDCYAKRCNEKKHLPKNVLIAKESEIAEDFKRESPDYDLATGIEGDLDMANRLVSKFFAWKLLSQKVDSVYDIKTSVLEAIDFSGKLGIILLNDPRQFDFCVSYFEEQISASFYNKYYSNKNFALSSFGPDDLIIDHNFLPEEKLGRTIFLQNSLNVPSIDPIKQIINILHRNIPFDEILNMNLLPKITPSHPFRNGLASIVARAGKRMIAIDISDVDDRGWGACITNKSIGYDAWEAGLQEKLFNKTKDADRLNFLKNKWVNHLYKDPLALIPLGFHALLSRVRNAEHHDKGQIWWNEISRWYDNEIRILEKSNSLPAHEKLPFFMDLKAILDNKSVPFNLCSDFLQLCGCLALSAQSNDSSALNVCLSNPEADWHEMKISQKIDKRVYAISIPLDLNRALGALVKLKEEEIDSICSLLKHLRPHKEYDRELIPIGLFNEEIATQACKCFKQPSSDLTAIAYEILLLCAFSNPEPSILNHLIKYLPQISDEQIAKGNLRDVLDSFPNNVEIQNLVGPLKSFCQSVDDKFNTGRYELCLEWALAAQCHSAINLYSSLKLTLTEKIKFIKTVLLKDVVEALKLFAQLQNDDDILHNDELDLFITLVGVVKRNQQQRSYISQLVILTSCAKMFLHKQGSNLISQTTSDHISQLIKSLFSTSLAQEASDLLASISAQQRMQTSNYTDQAFFLKASEDEHLITELRMKLLKRVVTEKLLNSNVIFSQLSWISSEYLKKDQYDPAQLLEIHKFLMACLQLKSSPKIDVNIAIALATALLSHKLVPQAINWIDYSISEEEAKLSDGAVSALILPIDTWSQLLLEQNQLKLCLKYLQSLKNVKCLSSIKADLYFNVAKAYLKTNPAISAQLLLDNWETLETDCISEDWKTLSRSAIKNWLMIFQDSQMAYLESSELLRMLDSYSELLRLHSSDLPQVKKDSSLILFQASHHNGWRGVKKAFEVFSIMLESHANDLDWVEQSTAILAKSLSNVTVNSKRYFLLLAHYDDILKLLYKSSPSAFYKFIFKYVEKSLQANLPEGLMRTFILNHIGGSLNCFLTNYTTSDKNEILEIVNLVEKYLFCFPVRHYDYSISVNTETHEFEAFEYSSDNDTNILKKSRISENQPLLIMEQKYFETLNKESSAHEEANQKNDCADFFFTYQYFAKKFQLLQHIMFECGFYKDKPKAALISKLAVIEDLEEKSDDMTLAMSELTPIAQLEVFTNVINRLKSLQHGPASHKALSIIKFIPQALWESYPEELSNLLIQVMNQDSTYPYCNKQVFDLIMGLIVSNKNIPHWIDISSKLAFLFYDKLSACGTKDDSKKIPPSTCYLHTASLFICSALMNEFIKDDHENFMTFFKAHLQRLAQLNSHRPERETLTNFIETSFLNNPAHASKMKEAIKLHFNKL